MNFICVVFSKLDTRGFHGLQFQLWIRRDVIQVLNVGRFWIQDSYRIQNPQTQCVRDISGHSAIVLKGEGVIFTFFAGKNLSKKFSAPFMSLHLRSLQIWLQPFEQHFLEPSQSLSYVHWSLMQIPKPGSGHFPALTVNQREHSGEKKNMRMG